MIICSIAGRGSDRKSHSNCPSGSINTYAFSRPTIASMMFVNGLASAAGATALVCSTAGAACDVTTGGAGAMRGAVASAAPAAAW